jgi:signal transduction histidine kinase
MLIQPSKPAKTRDWRHDFGEPLLAIRLYAEVLQSEPDIDPKMRQTGESWL